MLIGKEILLRFLKLEDLDFLYSIENNINYFEFSDNPQFYSKTVLKEYIKNSNTSISIYNQLRFVIEHKKKAVGLIDLFDYDFKTKSAGIGIIVKEEFQNLNFGSESLGLLISFAWEDLDLLSLYANINSDNTRSIKLFEKFGFIKKDELLFQLNR